MNDAGAPSSRTAVVRLPARGRYDRATIDAILDAAFLCHVAFAVDGQPYAIPTGYVRSGDEIFIHGSAASRMLRVIQGGGPLCITVTLLDGLVLARSAFHHSFNYRSVVVLGRGRLVDDPAEKLEALRRFVNHVVRDRWDEVRPPTAQELKATTVVAMGLTECSAKVRTGPPIDDEEDLALPVWAGVVPLASVAAEAVPVQGLADAAGTFGLERVRGAGA